MDSEVAQLIQQSLEQDRLKLLAQQSSAQINFQQNSNSNLATFVPVVQNIKQQEQTTTTKMPALIHNRNYSGNFPESKQQSRLIDSSKLLDESQIKSRILTLEQELSGSQKKAEQMCDVLENTRTHYSQLENKYDQARKLLKNYQER